MAEFPQKHASFEILEEAASMEHSRTGKHGLDDTFWLDESNTRHIPTPCLIRRFMRIHALRASPSVAILFATLRDQHPFPGGHSGVVPPDPIPNSEVKRISADGSLAFAMQE